MDLAEWYANGRWVALLELIDQLPTACRLNEAIANDPVAARELLAQADTKGKPTQKWTPRVSEWDLQALMTREVIGSLDALRQTILKVNGNTPKQLPPFPIPHTEIDRAKAEAERKFAVDIVTLFGFDASDL